MNWRCKYLPPSNVKLTTCTHLVSGCNEQLIEQNHKIHLCINACITTCNACSCFLIDAEKWLSLWVFTHKSSNVAHCSFYFGEPLKLKDPIPLYPWNVITFQGYKITWHYFRLRWTNLANCGPQHFCMQQIWHAPHSSNSQLVEILPCLLEHFNADCQYKYTVSR